MKKNFLIFVSLCLLSTAKIFAQGIPDQWEFINNYTQLQMGKMPLKELYNDSTIRRIDLDFYSNPNYWTQLGSNYASKTNLPAKLSYENGQKVLDSVGVRFKGNTSYMNVSSSQKKSFNLELDWKIAGQDISGYSTLNLNNAFGDRSFLREVMYGHLASMHIPAVKTNFAKLYLNGENWGLYPNVQQVGKDLFKDWFTSNNGISWRADKPAGTSGPGPGPGGGGWGDGTAALNWRGTTDTAYNKYYTLKYSDLTTPWEHLKEVCDKLNNTPIAQLKDSVDKYMDLDRTLWFLATEIAFTDDDSYVHKGKMDYYIFKEEVTNRSVPIEFDGNSPMSMSAASSWSPFYNETKVNYPLLNRLLQVPEIRQRYIAHMKTIMEDEFNSTTFNNQIDYYVSLIDTVVQNDTKKLYTYAQFLSEINLLKNFITTRKNYIMSNTEFLQPAPTIASATQSFNSTAWQRPTHNQNVQINTQVSFTTGLNAVNLYYSSAINGRFVKTVMYDDGLHQDGAANDGNYGASIPGFAGGTWVRWYIEAEANNPAKTMSYLPKGAEHDVYVYLVIPNNNNTSGVVINEVMPANTTKVADNYSEYDDWIELYNRSSNAVDISGWSLTDDQFNLGKYVFPTGTFLPANSYLIIWADENGSQGWDHANFKLSATNGETLYLLNTAGEYVDQTTWGTMAADTSWARSPNGTGNFIVKYQTFSMNNDFPAAINDVVQNVEFILYPNPAHNYIDVKYTGNVQNEELVLLDMTGKIINKEKLSAHVRFDLTHLSQGMYLIKAGNTCKKFVVE